MTTMNDKADPTAEGYDAGVLEGVQTPDIWEDIPLDCPRGAAGSPQGSAMRALSYDLRNSGVSEIYCGDKSKSAGARERDGKLTRTTKDGCLYELKVLAQASGDTAEKLASAKVWIEAQEAEGNTPWKLEQAGAELPVPPRNRQRAKTARLAKMREERDALLSSPAADQEPVSKRPGIGHNRPPPAGYQESEEEIFRQRQIDMRVGPREINFETISYYADGNDYVDGIFAEDNYGVPRSAIDPEMQRPQTKAQETVARRALNAEFNKAADGRQAATNSRRPKPVNIIAIRGERERDDARRELFVSPEAFEHYQIQYADHQSQTEQAAKRNFERELGDVTPAHRGLIMRRLCGEVGRYNSISLLINRIVETERELHPTASNEELVARLRAALAAYLAPPDPKPAGHEDEFFEMVNELRDAFGLKPIKAAKIKPGSHRKRNRVDDNGLIPLEKKGKLTKTAPVRLICRNREELFDQASARAFLTRKPWDSISASEAADPYVGEDSRDWDSDGEYFSSLTWWRPDCGAHGDLYRTNDIHPWLPAAISYRRARQTRPALRAAGIFFAPDKNI